MRILTGKELRYAAENRRLVKCVIDYHNSNEGSYIAIGILEPKPIGYYIGTAEIEPEIFGDNEPVTIAYDEGDMRVESVFGVSYKERSKPFKFEKIEEYPLF